MNLVGGNDFVVEEAVSVAAASLEVAATEEEKVVRVVMDHFPSTFLAQYQYE